MEVNEVCARCGRQHKIDCESDILLEKIQAQRAMKGVVSELTSYVKSLDGPLPAIIIITSDKSVRVLENLCAESTGKFKGCVNRVATLVAEILGKGMKP